MMKHKLPPIYFLHIPKTAGSSLGQLILCSYPQGSQLNCSLSQLLQMSREEISQFKCFAGHWGTGLFSLLDKEISSITMLRDPFERTVSNCLFIKRIVVKKFASNPLALDEVEDLKLKSDISELLKCTNIREMLNLMPSMKEQQSCYLGCDIDLNEYLGVSQCSLDTLDKSKEIFIENIIAQQLSSGLLDINEIFNKAKQRLDAMEVVGIMEQFNDSAHLICNSLGISTPKNLPRENVSPENLALGNLTYRKSGTIPDDVIKQIDELTVCDREIYEYGKKLFNKQLQTEKRKFFWFKKMFKKSERF
ncbi:sulfotransferase family 2 domain-containing protein [Pseudanabaena yagii]|uniref:Sulfotransferase family protein n=1 Tax=Pseudanabaena yagii GIHE-NHR1 TaxID=2722753 RepID=A0ABX1LRB6_9CYAN|nr:sulfotransferase family 2 domain-containing protein [Pseudanabaena yagii]NMF58668.1 sulfotransferase family protein [Pseudanabaena yagii GIHE-NHR1]